MQAPRNAALRLAIVAVSVLAGCSMGGGGQQIVTPYGVVPPRVPLDPELELVDLTYAPAGPVELGEEITFRVTANKPFTEYDLFVRIAENYNTFDWAAKSALTAQLLDDGNPPDETAGDAVFSGSLTLPDWIGVHEGLPVIARIDWWSSAQAPWFFGEPLTVLEPEVGDQ